MPLAKYFRSAYYRAKISFSGCHCASSALIHVNSWENLRLESKVSIGHGVVIIVSDEKSIPGITSFLNIGSGTSINEYANIRAAGGGINIGKNCLIAQFVTIVASNHIVDKDNEIIENNWEPLRNGVSIGDGSWIGAGSIILPGVNIGRGCVIGAGSVVTRDVSDNEIVVGNPAKYIRSRSF